MLCVLTYFFYDYTSIGFGTAYNNLFLAYALSGYYIINDGKLIRLKTCQLPEDQNTC
jgi:hypothetical protein